MTEQEIAEHVIDWNSVKGNLSPGMTGMAKKGATTFTFKPIARLKLGVFVGDTQIATEEFTAQLHWPDSSQETDLVEDAEAPVSPSFEEIGIRGRALMLPFIDKGYKLVLAAFNARTNRIRVEAWRREVPEGDILVRWSLDTNKPYNEVLKSVQPEEILKPEVKRPATAEELNALLNSEDDKPITILPDGTIAPKADEQRPGDA